MLERAAELWARKLANPVFDNGDNSELGFLTMGLASLNIQADKEKQSDAEWEKRRQRFKNVLIRNLQDQLERGYIWLDVDYHPCQILADAAQEAEIPASQFSCKSSVSVHSDKVSTSFGYGAEYVNHYPLPNGDWLITTLSGSDISKIIDLVAAGQDLGLTIEHKKPLASEPK